MRASCASVTMPTGTTSKNVDVQYDGANKARSFDFEPSTGSCEVAFSCDTPLTPAYKAKLCGTDATANVIHEEKAVYDSS